jgi:signal peptidase I
MASVFSLGEIGAMQKSLKGTWGQAIASLLMPLLLVFSVRWLIIEPYVIPSGSMIPTLLVHDHILVNKLAYGLRAPFSEWWLMRWGHIDRGDVIVFKYPENKDIFYVKRVIALPGETLEIKAGHVLINNKMLRYKSKADELSSRDGEAFTSQFQYLQEENHTIRYYKGDLRDIEYGPLTIPAGKYLVLGDNRDQSSDSRVWGLVDQDLILGRASVIWLSCNEMLTSAPFVCDPNQLRWHRMFEGLN